MNLLSSLQSILTYPSLESPDVHGNPMVFCQKVNNSLITKSPFKVVSYGASLVSQTTQHTFLFLSLECPTPPAEYLKVQKLPSTFMAEHGRLSH